MSDALRPAIEGAELPDERLETIGDRNPYHALIGVELVERADGIARCRLPVTAKVAGGVAGSVHGGVLSALVDIAALHAIPTILVPGDTMAGTAELSISYLRPALTTMVYATARVLKKGRTLAVCDVEITDAEHRLVAKGRVSYALRPEALLRERNPIAGPSSSANG